MQCSYCGIDKPADAFRKNGLNKDGTQKYSKMCKSCNHEFRDNPCGWDYNRDLQIDIAAGLLAYWGLTKEQVQRRFAK